MAQIRALVTINGKSSFVPLAAVKIGSEYVLKTAGAVCTAKHYNGAGEVAPANVPFNAVTKSIAIYNSHATQTLQVSFDGGANYFDILPTKDLKINAGHTSVEIKASGAGTSYQILTTE